MGEEIGGAGLAGEVLRAGERLDEVADVGDEGRVLIVEEGLDVGEVGVEGEVGRGSEGQKGVLREGERAAEGGVIVVAGRVEGDKGVVAVVAAEEEDADQGLVAGGALGEGVEHAERAETGGVAGGGEGGVFDEAATVGHGVSPWEC